MTDQVAIVGVGWKGFTPTSPDLSYKELVYAAASQAYNEASLDPRRDIESFISIAEDFHEGTSIFDEYTPDQLGAASKPMHTISGDGLHGLASAYMLIKTGQFNIVAVEGHSKASNVRSLSGISRYAQDPILNRPLELNSDYIAGLEMTRFLHESGVSNEQCANVVIKNRHNALRNPSAAFGANLKISDVLNSQPISWPLVTSMKANHVDGAIVMVLASEKLAHSMTDKPIWVVGVGWCNDSASLEYRNWAEIPYVTIAAKMAYKQADIKNPCTEIDFAEIDDSYAYKELQSLAALGFCSYRDLASLSVSGNPASNFDVPINVSGGSLGIGHLLDATGLCKALEVVIQLRGEAGARQLKNIELGLAQSWRGVPTTSGAVVILSV
jgi:acetyl-CoA C-acetyltransferase